MDVLAMYILIENYKSDSNIIKKNTQNAFYKFFINDEHKTL